MPNSRFWRSIVVICSLLSGAYVIIQAFQAIKQRFSSGKDQPAIEAALRHTSALFSRLPRVTIQQTINKVYHGEPDISTTAIPAPLQANAPQSNTRRVQIPVAIPSLSQSNGVGVQTPLAVPQEHTEHTTRQSPGKRALVLVSALVLTAIIATSFMFSVRLFSASLGQPGNAQANVIPPKLTPKLTQPPFQRGIIYPRWSNDAYGLNDTTWQQSIASVKTQTGAQWLEIPVLFTQPTSSATVVGISSSAPSVQSFTAGIERAHSLGYKVFFVPLMQVRQPGGWSGSITFKTLAQQQAWFDSYWNALLPYISAAASQHVDQMAIATELQTLQNEVPDTLWNQLIERMHSVFNGTLTYDMNWSSLTLSMPAWLHNSNLTYIGVSTYIPLLDKAGRVAPQDMPALWKSTIKTQLDALAIQLGKRVLISEIGYRNSSDALYRTWEAHTKANADPQEQAGAYDAALSNVFHDAHIAGTFFWGWSDVGQFAINGQPATQVLLKWYTLKLA